MSELDESFSEQKAQQHGVGKESDPGEEERAAQDFTSDFGTVLKSWGTQRTQRRQLSSTVGSGYLYLSC
jgi:hypothetical protein